MTEELDFNEYPTLHMEYMVDDYNELFGERENGIADPNLEWHGSEGDTDRFSFCHY